MRNYYEEIKEELIDNEVYKKAKDYSKNRHDLESYYNVGKLLVEAQGGEERAKYGNGLIKEYSKKLTEEVGKGFDERNLRNMRQFYIFFQKQKWNPLDAKLTWSHYKELMKLDNISKINYYINICLQLNLSKRELIEHIKSDEYERLPDETKLKLTSNEKETVTDLVKNPIIIKTNRKIKETIAEKFLHQIVLDDIKSFMDQLGVGFTFAGSEYKFKIGNEDHRIDILLFNYKFNCFVVCELKVTKAKPEHIGQLLKYINYVDRHIKEPFNDKTVGILICKEENKLVMSYCTNPSIFTTTYLIENKTKEEAK